MPKKAPADTVQAKTDGAEQEQMTRRSKRLQKLAEACPEKSPSPASKAKRAKKEAKPKLKAEQQEKIECDAAEENDAPEANGEDNAQEVTKQSDKEDGEGGDAEQKDGEAEEKH